MGVFYCILLVVSLSVEIREYFVYSKYKSGQVIAYHSVNLCRRINLFYPLELWGVVMVDNI